MRWLTLAAAAVVVGAGCGSESRSAAPATPRSTSARATCVKAAAPYAICGKSPTGGKGPSTIQRGGTIVAQPIEKIGRWRKVFVSPDRKNLLAEWSGSCEIPTAYVVSTAGGHPRAVTDYSHGSAISFALGWTGSKARVALPVGQPPTLEPGIYLVDPTTMAKTLVRALPRAHGC